MALTISNLNATHRVPYFHHFWIERLASSHTAFQSPRRVTCIIASHLSRHKLTIGCRWSTQSCDGVQMQDVKHCGGRERPRAILDEKSRTSIPCGEPGPVFINISKRSDAMPSIVSHTMRLLPTLAPLRSNTACLGPTVASKSQSKSGLWQKLSAGVAVLDLMSRQVTYQEGRADCEEPSWEDQ